MVGLMPIGCRRGLTADPGSVHILRSMNPPANLQHAMSLPTHLLAMSLPANHTHLRTIRLGTVRLSNNRHASSHNHRTSSHLLAIPNSHSHLPMYPLPKFPLMVAQLLLVYLKLVSSDFHPAWWGLILE